MLTGTWQSDILPVLAFNFLDNASGKVLKTDKIMASWGERNIRLNLTPGIMLVYLWHGA